MSTVPPVIPRFMKVFLCHSSGDKPAVRELYRRLKEDGFQPWFDEVDLKPGQPWRETIEAAVRTSDAVVVCLSTGSVGKEGFLNREIKVALRALDEKPEGTIFVIPARLEAVEIPGSLRDLQWANLYDEGGYERLVGALKERASAIGRPAPAGVTSLPGGAGSKLVTGQGGTGTQRPEPEAGGLWEWLRARMGLTLIVIGVMVVLLTGITYKLYQIRKQYRAEAIGFNREGMEKLRSLDTTNAEILLGRAVTADPGNALMHANYAVTLGERGNYTAAKAEVQKAFEKKSSLSERDADWVEGVKNEMNWQLGPAADSYAVGWGRHKDTEAGLRLAWVQTLSGKGSTALETLNDLERNAASAGDPRIAYERAMAADAEKDFEAEVKTLDKIIAEHSKDQEPLIVAAALSQKCAALPKVGNAKQAVTENRKAAEKACTDAIPLFTKQTDRLGLARTYTRQAVIKMSVEDRNAEAKQLLSDAIDTASSLGSEIDEAGARQNRANWFINADDVDNARKDHDAAVELYKKIGNQEGLADLENNWGTSLIDSCKFEGAETAFQSALKEYEKTNSREGPAIATYNRGLMRYLLGDLSKAESDVVSALRSADKLKLESEKPEWLNTLGEVYLAQNRLPLAERCFRGENCYEDAATPGHVDHPGELQPSARRELALVQIEQGHPADAEHVARALIHELGQDKDSEPDDEGMAHDLLGRALIAQGGNLKLAEARDTIGTAQNLSLHDCRIPVSLAITSSRAAGHLKQFPVARDRVTKSFQQAKDKKLRGYELEALLAQAEIEFLAGQLDKAEKQATELIGNPEVEEYKLIKSKADKLLKEIRSKQTH